MTHEIFKSGTYRTGAQEWRCSQCDYRLIVQWTPLYKKIILSEGDMTVTHGASLELEALALMNGETPQEPDFPDDLKDQINDVLGGLE